MTIEEKLKRMLFECGVFESQCDAVMERAKADKDNEAMEGRWGDAIDDCPESLLNVLWLSMKQHALEYIDANCPKAWFRPLFTVEGASQ